MEDLADNSVVEGRRMVIYITFSTKLGNFYVVYFMLIADSLFCYGRISKLFCEKLAISHPMAD